MVTKTVHRGFNLAFWIAEVSFTCFLLILEASAHILWFFIPFRSVLRSKFGVGAKSDPTLEMNFVELVNHYGYKAEEHYVQTKDGYILGVHRMPPKDVRKARGVVFFQHGFMQNSEAFIVRGPNKALPFILVDQGYDVWLGNNRGNKYSHKHLQHSPEQEVFWDFSLDDFALSDIPSMLGYVLETSNAKTLSYIGFSQGTAQAFAAFSVNAQLAERVNLFIALAPATRIKELHNPIVASLTVKRPQLMFLLFGKKALLKEALFWKAILPTTAFVTIVDYSMKFLFGWTCNQIDDAEKPLLYSHIYSYSSVKALVHWFQITRLKRFQMFDGRISPLNTNSYLLPTYQPNRIACPIAVFYGGKDTIPEMDILLTEVQDKTANYIHMEPEYEHLDFIWAVTAPENIYTKVSKLVNQVHSPQNTAAVTNE